VAGRLRNVPPSPPPAVDALRDVVLLDDAARDVRLSDLWRDRPVVLSFLRHFG
jgi:hypothetical protein